MTSTAMKSRLFSRSLFTLLIVSSCATFDSYSVQSPSGKRYVSIDYLGKSGSATRNVNGTEYSLVPQQAEWAQMLYLDKNYDEVTKGIQELLAHDSESNSFTLFDRYEVISNIPDDKYIGLMKDVLDEWCRKNPDSHIPWLVRGAFYLDLAFNIRGGGYASTVSGDSWKRFHENLEWAQKDLEHSYKLNPKDPNSSCFLIRVDLGLEHDFEEMEKHFINATMACPEHYGARRLKYVFLLPQWYGSVEKMNEFADECLALSDKYPYLGLIKAVVYVDMMVRRNVDGYAGHVERYIDGNNVWPAIEGIYKKILNRYPDSLLARLDYARSAVLSDKKEIALDQFKIIGDRFMMYSFWPSLDNYDEVRSSIRRAIAGDARNRSPHGDANAANTAPSGNSSGNAAGVPPPQIGQSAYPDTQARYRHADQLALQGKNNEALAEYMWCFDEGMRKAPEYAGVRLSFLLNSIVRLGKQYPPALQQLRDRRDAAKASLNTDPRNFSAQADFAAINRELGENDANLAFYDQLPLGGPLRTSFGLRIIDCLIEAKRYRDAVEAKPYESFLKEMGNIVDMASKSPGSPMIHYILNSGGKELEALAGAGNLDQARSLLKLLKKVDQSEQTLKNLRLHLERAGHMELLEDNNQQEPLMRSPLNRT
jgi:hypothetical protein